MEPTPSEPENPLRPGQAAAPEEPVGPAPDKAGIPAAEAEQPVVPARPKTEEAPAGEAQQPTEIPAPATDAPTVPAATPSPTPRPETTARPANHNSNSGRKTPKRERFSKKYPYRRVRMHPQEGIWAEAAGELVWPLP